MIGDHTVFHVVPHWRASPKIVAPSKRNCRIAQRIARTPRRAQGAHTFSLCSRNVTVWQVRSRHIQRRIVPPDPHGTPAQGRVDHFHHDTPVTVSKSPHNPGIQHSDHTGVSVEHETTLTPSDSNQMEALQVDEQITPVMTTKQRRTAAGSVRHRPRSLKTAGVEDCSSSRTLSSTRNHRPTPGGHPHSTQKSRFWQVGWDMQSMSRA